jgi:EpsI family protein
MPHPAPLQSDGPPGVAQARCDRTNNIISMTSAGAVSTSAPTTRRTAVQAWCLAVCMVAASVTAHQLRPHKLLADTRGPTTLAMAIPASFGQWQEVLTGQVVVNPQSQQLINTLYTEVLNRTYRNTAGQHVMLAIAYGRDQSDELQVHEPAVCYPAQGFTITRQENARLETSFGGIPVHHLETQLGPTRPEPVTYWTTVGDRAIEPAPFDKKMKKFEYSIQGYIPDGLLFRVSSIDPDSIRAFSTQARFVQDLLSNVTPVWRARLAGLASNSDASPPH